MSFNRRDFIKLGGYASALAFGAVPLMAAPPPNAWWWWAVARAAQPQPST